MLITTKTSINFNKKRNHLQFVQTVPLIIVKFCYLLAFLLSANSAVAVNNTSVEEFRAVSHES